MMHHTSTHKTAFFKACAAGRKHRQHVQSAATALKGAHLNWDYPHAHTLPVMPEAGDIDGLQHTNNAVYVRWCEHIAWHHSATLGLDLDGYQRLDRAMAIRRGEYDYLPPEFLAAYEPAIVAARQPVQV